MSEMQFRILGPLEAVDQGKALPLGGGRQLALFALLLLNANEVVSTDRLVDELWTEQPPATAEKIVRNYVSLLRKQLGDRLVRRPPGYLLRVEPGELDSERFETLVREAREQEPAAAAATLREALALSSGPPLAQLEYEPFAQRAAASLEELRLQALEDRIQADLELGRERDVLPELERLVRDQPLRERPRGLLMLALYRSGRQADALDVYRDARRALVDELGLEPSPALQALQRQILAHDESLAGPPQRTRASSRRRRGALLIAVGGAILLAGGLAAGLIELTGSAPAGLSRIDPNSVGVIDTRTNRIVGEVPVGGNPTRMALANGSLWVVSTKNRTASHIDAKRRVALQPVPLPGEPTGIGADGKVVWVVYRRGEDSGYGQGAAGAALIDPRFSDVTLKVPLNQLFHYKGTIAVGPHVVWAAEQAFVTRFDRTTGKIRDVFPVGYSYETGVAVGEGAVWAIGGEGIVRIDPSRKTDPLPTIRIAQTATGAGPSPTALAVGEHAVWVASRYVISNGFSTSGRRGTVYRIDPKTNAVAATITVGHEPFAIAAGGGWVWVTNRTDFSVMKIDPRKNKVVATIKVGGRPEGLAVGNGEVWVSVGER